MPGSRPTWYLTDEYGSRDPTYDLQKLQVTPLTVPLFLEGPFTEDIVAKFPNQPGRASWQLSRSAVLEWVSRWRAENDANGEASPET